MSSLCMKQSILLNEHEKINRIEALEMKSRPTARVPDLAQFRTEMKD